MPRTAHPAATSASRRRVLPRRVLLLSVVLLTLATLLAGPVSAHPSIRGGEAPVDSLATLTLAMAHGCGSESEEGGEPTTDVSLEVPEWLRVVEVPEPEGWTVEIETAEDGTPTVVTWSAEEPQIPAPAFDLDVVASGEPGDQRYLRVFQACDDEVYRWVGTPEEPADDPAVNLTLAAADPDAPAPPEQPAPAPDAGADDPDSGPADDGDPEAADPAEDDVDTDDVAGGDGAAGDGAGDGAAGDGAGDGAAGGAAAGDEEQGGLPGWFVPVTVIVLLAAVGAVLAGRRGRATS